MTFYRALLSVLLLSELLYVRPLVPLSAWFLYFMLSATTLSLVYLAGFARLSMARRGYLENAMLMALVAAKVDAVLLMTAYLLLLISVANLPPVSATVSIPFPILIAALFMILATCMVRAAEKSAADLRTQRLFPKPLSPTLVVTAYFAGLGLPVIIAFISDFFKFRRDEYGQFVSLLPANICLLTIALFSVFMAVTLWLCGGLSGVSRRVKLWGGVIAALYALFSYFAYSVSGQGLYQYLLSVTCAACVLLSCAMILSHLVRAERESHGATPGTASDPGYESG
jgi:hypothetical protein